MSSNIPIAPWAQCAERRKWPSRIEEKKDDLEDGRGIPIGKERAFQMIRKPKCKREGIPNWKLPPTVRRGHSKWVETLLSHRGRKVRGSKAAFSKLPSRNRILETDQAIDDSAYRASSLRKSFYARTFGSFMHLLRRTSVREQM